MRIKGASNDKAIGHRAKLMRIADGVATKQEGSAASQSA
jgi:hypothetical protein